MTASLPLDITAVAIMQEGFSTNWNKNSIDKQYNTLYSYHKNNQFLVQND